jgi:hypothetical protein
MKTRGKMKRGGVMNVAGRILALTTWALCVPCATPATAQDTAGVLAAVGRIFEGMRTANPSMVRGIFAADARFAVLDATSGSTRVTVPPAPTARSPGPPGAPPVRRRDRVPARAAPGCA